MTHSYQAQRLDGRAASINPAQVESLDYLRREGTHPHFEEFKSLTLMAAGEALSDRQTACADDLLVEAFRPGWGEDHVEWLVIDFRGRIAFLDGGIAGQRLNYIGRSLSALGLAQSLPYATAA